MIRIKAEPREKLGKEEAKKIRRQGWIPAVVYGGGKVYGHIKVKLSDMRKLLHEGTRQLELEMPDGKVLKVILQDVQIHPVTDQPIHFDFYVPQSQEKEETKN